MYARARLDALLRYPSLSLFTSTMLLINAALVYGTCICRPHAVGPLMSLPSRALECSPNNTACIAVLLGLFRLPSGPSRDNVGGCNIRFSPLLSPPLGAEKGAATAACILQKLSDPILFRFPPPPKEQACVCVVGYRSPPHSSNLPPTLLSAWAPAAAAAQIKRPPNMGRKREDKDLLLFDRLLLLLLLSSRVSTADGASRPVSFPRPICTAAAFGKYVVGGAGCY